MRYLTVHVHPEDGSAFHPLGADLAADPDITREAIHHVEHLPDGTVLMLAEGSGDRRRYEAIMDESPYVLDYLVSGGERWMAVSQFEPTDTIRRMFELRQEVDVVVETPIRVNDDGSLRVTHLGSDEAFQRLFRESIADSEVSVEVVDTGEYDPDEPSLTRLLTVRQQEVLEAAVEVGYYASPREATLEDVGDAVGTASTTAGEHLRKIEERVFSELAQ